MEEIFSPRFNVGFIFILISVICSFILIIYYLNQKLLFFKQEVEHLKSSIKNLDHQAKLIIKNDIELKLYQEAVNDKLRKLSFLKNFISASLNILDREKLFSQINREVIRAMKFEKACIVTFQDLETIVNLDFTSQELTSLKQFIEKNRDIFATTPLISSNSGVAQELKEVLSAREFLISPIVSGAKIYAIFCLYKCSLPEGMSEAEEEVFSIICMYLGQCLDNIKLFEALYRTGEELEDKVKEKTLQLTKTLKEIEDVSKMKSEFISSVSHELRTPLTSIKGFSSLLVGEKFGKLPPQAKERLKKIDENVNKLVDMVNTLLDISRIEAKKIEVKIAPSDICKLIQDVVDFLMPQAENRGVSLVANTPPALMVLMDSNLIERVLVNLINNAIKFTPPEGKIEVKCVREGSKAKILVSDTGYGIPPEDLENIFREFYRVNDPKHRQIKGSGLGLSLVKRIIETHKEKIWVESEVNKGTTFYFTLEVAENV